MGLDVYLNFNGNTREAVQYYAKVFQTDEPKIMTFGDVPQDPSHPIPEEAKSLVMHTNITILGSKVMFSDVFPGMPFQQGNNISISLTTNNEEQLKDWFLQLKDGGKVVMELQETFWAKLYGGVVDKFGIEWQFNCEK